MDWHTTWANGVDPDQTAPEEQSDLVYTVFHSAEHNLQSNQQGLNLLEELQVW